MKIAVVQHKSVGTVVQDAFALAQTSRVAADAGAEVVFFPPVLPIDEELAHETYEVEARGLAGIRLLPSVGSDDRSRVFPVTSDIPVVGERLGRTALIHGDACFDRSMLELVQRAGATVLILTPGCESELQAEAMLEFAIGLSKSVAGLVIVADSVGAEPGESGHGSSAVILFGEVVAEGSSEEAEILYAEVPEPVAPLEAPEPVPAVPPLLAQRLARHEGHHVVPDYPADLDDEADEE